MNVTADAPSLTVAPFNGMGVIQRIETDGNTLVAVYELPNFKGACGVVGANGPATQLVGIMTSTNGRLGSLRLGRGPLFRCDGLILYENFNYEGRSVIVMGTASDLGKLGFDNIASSARVIGASSTAEYYLHSDFGMTGRCSTIRGDVPQLNALGVGNDQASSVSDVPMSHCNGISGTWVALYDAADAGGNRLLIENDIPDLSPLGFNDKTASLIAEKAPILLFSNPNYQGVCYDNKGLYSTPNLANTPLGVHSVSSVKWFGECPPAGPVTLWSADSYEGNAL
ncbi:MAG: beta/gamma crystallin-related protein, partial [Chloroflexi bacterium]|nr:beta/gamma crystallin-related protein [Chloroflexota bacterium]